MTRLLSRVARFDPSADARPLVATTMMSITAWGEGVLRAFAEGTTFTPGSATNVVGSASRNRRDLAYISGTSRWSFSFAGGGK